MTVQASDEDEEVDIDTFLANCLSVLAEIVELKKRSVDQKREINSLRGGDIGIEYR